MSPRNLVLGTTLAKYWPILKPAGLKEIVCKCSVSVRRVLDLGSRGLWFKSHWRHCVVSLIKTLYSLLSLSAGSTTPVCWMRLSCGPVSI